MMKKIYPGNRGENNEVMDQLALDNCATAPHPEMVRMVHPDDACHDDWGQDI